MGFKYIKSRGCSRKGCFKNTLYFIESLSSPLLPGTDGFRDPLLSLKELTPPCPVNSAWWRSPLDFLLSRSSHHPSPNPTIKGHKNGTKIPAKGYYWRDAWKKTRDKIHISLGKKKGQVFQNYKIKFMRVGNTTNHQHIKYFQSSKVKFFICTWIVLGEESIMGQKFPVSLSPL